MRDLPAGHYEITASGDGSQKVIAVDLQDGEARTGVDIALDPLVTLTGRLIEYGTQRPVTAMYVFAAAARSGAAVTLDLDTARLSDASGRFSVPDVPVGQVGVRGIPKDAEANDYPAFYIVRAVDGSGTVDIGDIGVLRRRVKPGEVVGDLGLHFVVQPGDTPVDKLEYKISWIDPAGAAASSGLVVGDVIVSCDGVDVTGTNSVRWPVLVAAPPGTRITLGTRRGVIVTLVLAAP